MDLATFYSEPAIQSSKIDLQANTDYVDYLDAFHCEADSISGVFICYNYQPDYTDIGESDGYPRFSKDDPVLAAFIDSTQSEANFWPQTLFNSASGLLSAAIAISVITFML